MNSELDCSICADALLTNVVEVTKCGHAFHSECLQTWFAQKRVCPLCKTPALGTFTRVLHSWQTDEDVLVETCVSSHLQSGEQLPRLEDERNKLLRATQDQADLREACKREEQAVAVAKNRLDSVQAQLMGVQRQYFAKRTERDRHAKALEAATADGTVAAEAWAQLRASHSAPHTTDAAAPTAARRPRHNASANMAQVQALIWRTQELKQLAESIDEAKANLRQLQRQLGKSTHSDTRKERRPHRSEHPMKKSRHIGANT